MTLIMMEVNKISVITSADPVILSLWFPMIDTPYKRQIKAPGVVRIPKLIYTHIICIVSSSMSKYYFIAVLS